jgi:MurNAc alpha-1-phosphate uridylyltransferase
MLLAAGLGRRMRPLTETTAKPLVPLGGRTLLDHALDRLEDAGVGHVVVNTHWHADKVAHHLAARADAGFGPRTIVRHEPVLLDTGGAVTAALADGLLDDAPFYIVNGDAFWLDGPLKTLTRLADAFDPKEADAVLLLHRAYQVLADIGAGDFALDPWGMPRRPKPFEIVPYIFAGVQIATPALFTDAHPVPFSTNVLWNRAIAAGRLRGLVHDGLWFHLSTPSDLDEASHALRHAAPGGPW